MSRIALITGITGQDGSYLADLLLKQGYEVHGTSRRAEGAQCLHFPHLRDRVRMHQLDLRDESRLTALLQDIQPTEIYHLAAETFVPESWVRPVESSDITALGTARLLEAARQANPSIRVFQANSSHIFGQPEHAPQNEDTPLSPRSPYAAAKAYAHWMVRCYREHHGMFACSGILYNHESPWRGASFVSRKISLAAAKIKLGQQDKLELANLDSRRDWGFAGDYVQAMWLTLQHAEPHDFVIATGIQHSVREMAQIAFETVGLNASENVVVRENPALRDQTANMVGDASRAREMLGWAPTVNFMELMQMMVRADLERLSGAEAMM